MTRFNQSSVLALPVDLDGISSTKPPVWLFVLPWSLIHVGGVNQVVINLAAHMAATGSYEPIVLITDWEAPAPIWEVFQGVKVVRWRIRTLDPKMGAKKKLVFNVWKWRFTRLFRRFCKEHGVAVINPHYLNSVAFTLGDAASKAELKPKMIVSMHGADLTGIQASCTNTVALWCDFLARADALVVCSKSLGQKAIDIFGKRISPITVHNGIDVEKFIQLAGERLPMERRVILSVGKFEEKKGHDVLIKAFVSLAQDYADIDLVLIGAKANSLQGLRQLCISEGVEKRVFFHADMPHSEVATWFQRATLFVLPSRQEPFGIVLLEAGCLGIPVVASNVGGIPEILTESLTGCMVTPDDVLGLASVMRQLLDDPAAAWSMGERLRTCVTQNFSWTAAHDKYLRLASKNLE